MAELTRAAYAALYGPTVGDQVRLGDTDLWIEVEQDLTFGGEEAVFGGGKSIRESMAQGSTRPGPTARSTRSSPNAVVLDHWGIVRADVGIRDGRIVALGRAGNPDVADGVHPQLEIGPSTDVISGEGKILTAGAIDLHVHLISRSQILEALATGDHHGRRRRHRAVGGVEGDDRDARCLAPARGATEPSTRCRSTCCSSARATRSCDAGTDRAGAGRRRRPTRSTRTGASTPAAIDAALRAADEHGLQVALHSDSLNEAGYLESTVAAIGGRSIHAFHAEGAGGGHAPDILDGGAGLAARHPRVDQPDAPAHRQHRGRAPRHADGLPPPQPHGARGPRLRRVPDPRRPRSPPRTCCTTWAPCRSPPPTRRRWAGSAR